MYPLLHALNNYFVSRVKWFYGLYFRCIACSQFKSGDVLQVAVCSIHCHGVCVFPKGGGRGIIKD